MECKILYIAGPYRRKTINETCENIMEARRRMVWAWLSGWIPICPHTNSAFIDGIIPDRYILQGYKHLVTLCDAILLGSWGEGWQNSPGSVEEYQVATEHGLTIIKDPFKNATHNARGHSRT